jgi:hypothetical protein
VVIRETDQAFDDEKKIEALAEGLLDATRTPIRYIHAAIAQVGTPNGTAFVHKWSTLLHTPNLYGWQENAAIHHLTKDQRHPQQEEAQENDSP